MSALLCTLRYNVEPQVFLRSVTVVGEGLGSLVGPMGIQACFSSIQDVAS